MRHKLEKRFRTTMPDGEVVVIKTANQSCNKCIFKHSFCLGIDCNNGKETPFAYIRDYKSKPTEDMPMLITDWDDEYKNQPRFRGGAYHG